VIEGRFDPSPKSDQFVSIDCDAVNPQAKRVIAAVGKDGQHREETE
jgi:hypothetical protein